VNKYVTALIAALVLLSGTALAQTNNCNFCQPIKSTRKALDIGIYPAFAPNGGSTARELNDIGEVGGYSYPSNLPGDPGGGVAGVTVGFAYTGGVREDLNGFMASVMGVNNDSKFYGMDAQGHPGIAWKKGKKWKFLKLSELPGQVNGGSPNGDWFVGQVQVNGTWQPFVYDALKDFFQIIKNGFGASGWLNAANDKGDVAGWGMDGSGKHGYVIFDGKVIDLGIEVSDWTMANALTACRQVAVSSENAYYWNQILAVVTLCRPMNTMWGHSYGISESILVGELGLPDNFGGGSQAAYWTGGKLFILDTVGGLRSIAYGVNAKGDICGKSNNDPGHDRATLWLA
jgi:hypothetical protein